jgi:3-dehydroquinate synthase
MTKIAVNLPAVPARSYEITIGRGILAAAASELADAGWARRWAVVTDANVAGLHLGTVLAALRRAGVSAESFVVPAGEAHKTLPAAADLAARLLEGAFDRTCGILALGGGVVGDFAAFVASIFMRGIPVVQMPTTLLAQVDASVGGKTGVDVPQAKNVLGTFWQPHAVFSDLALLDTLPVREWTSGCAEIVKYGVIAEPPLLDGARGLRQREPAVVADLVARSCRIKAAIVAADERDAGRRRVLNFGHTIGHAIEAESGYTILHGEAVAMGMVCAARLSHRRGHLAAVACTAVERALAEVGLATVIPPFLRADDLLQRVARDKKKAGDAVAFVLVTALGEPVIASDVTEAEIRAVLQDVTA